MNYYKKKEEINRCLKLYFPSGLEVIVEEYNKEAVPWKEEIKSIHRPLYVYIPYNEDVLGEAQLRCSYKSILTILSELYDSPGKRICRQIDCTKIWGDDIRNKY